MVLLKAGVVSFPQRRLFWKHGDWLRNVTLLGDPIPLDKHPSFSVFARCVLILEWAPQLQLTVAGETLWPHLVSQTVTQSQVSSRTLHLWDFKQNSGSNYFCYNFWAQHIKIDQLFVFKKTFLSRLYKIAFLFAIL